MKNYMISGLLLGSLALLTGCASSGLLASSTTTNIELNRGNYRIAATSVTGQAKAEYLLGASFGAGIFTHSFALIPLTKDRALYKNAVENLWRNFETKNGTPIGKKFALINLRYDTEVLNLFLYTSPKLTVVADVIEFTE
jgi:hypothetical protein